MVANCPANRLTRKRSPCSPPNCLVRPAVFLSEDFFKQRSLFFCRLGRTGFRCLFWTRFLRRCNGNLSQPASLHEQKCRSVSCKKHFITRGQCCGNRNGCVVDQNLVSSAEIFYPVASLAEKEQNMFFKQRRVLKS